MSSHRIPRAALTHYTRATWGSTISVLYLLRYPGINLKWAACLVTGLQMSLAEVKAIGRKLGAATVNDVVMTAVAAGLAR